MMIQDEKQWWDMRSSSEDKKIMKMNNCEEENRWELWLDLMGNFEEQENYEDDKLSSKKVFHLQKRKTVK